MDGFALEEDIAFPGLPQTRDGFYQLILSITLHAGKTNDLIGANLHAEPAHGLNSSRAVHFERFDFHQHLARHRRLLLHPEKHGSAYHFFSQLDGRCLGGLDCRDQLSLPHHRDTIRDIHHFVQLVRYEDDCLAPVRQLPYRLEELFGFLRA